MKDILLKIDRRTRIGITLILSAGVFSALENDNNFLHGWLGFMAWGCFLIGWLIILINIIEDRY